MTEDQTPVDSQDKTESQTEDKSFGEKPQIDPSKMQPQDATTELVFELRKELHEIKEKMKKLKDMIIERQNRKEGYSQDADVEEMFANSVLAIRHNEDAAMRLGKVMQAKNGGVSVLAK